MTVIFAALMCGPGLSSAQIKKQFQVSGDKKVENVDLYFEVNNGLCSIKAGESDELVTVYSNQDYDNYAHEFDKDVRDKTCYIGLVLEGEQKDGFSKSISSRVFGGRSESSEKIWRVYLNRENKYNLNLKYGIGKADIDLSGISVETLKIHTGSADINIGYFSEGGNTVQMDTFYVKVDMGSVAIRKLDLANSKYFKADVGFGDLLLDISDDQKMSGEIIGSVGAGNLFIILPSTTAPMMIKVRDSWLCKVRVPDSFRKTAANTYINDAYAANSKDALIFNLDVSMGKIIFKEK